MISYAVRRLVENAPPEVLKILRKDSVLVPIPRHAPFAPGTEAKTLWVAREICGTLVRAGLAARVLPCLRRDTAVTKSAGADHRPPPETHRRSFRVTREIGESPERIVLVDDVVTRGSTFMGAAWALDAAFPGAQIDAFALVRTKGLIPDVDQVLEPVTGKIFMRTPTACDREP